MARKPRIEYPGAVYHVMSRGDRGGKIFKDPVDYELFGAAMDEVCKRCGWKVHAYGWLPNHFHWLLETREANLVAGMKWFLGAYSQRFNARHGQRGHVFQGRYKALPIETDSGSYFETVSTYIHLNPARAGLLKEGGGPETYSWSSYTGYVGGKRERRRWLEVDRVLGNLALRDDARGRQAYREYIEDRIRELGTKDGRKAFKEDWKPIRYGWYLGAEGFKEKLVKRVGKTVKGKKRASYGGKAIREHDESCAEELIRKGLKCLEVTEKDLGRLAKGHDVKCLLAWLAHTYTMVTHQWLTDRLQMGNPQTVSTYIKKVKQAEKGALARRRNKLVRTVV